MKLNNILIVILLSFISGVKSEIFDDERRNVFERSSNIVDDNQGVHAEPLDVMGLFNEEDVSDKIFQDFTNDSESSYAIFMLIRDVRNNYQLKRVHSNLAIEPGGLVALNSGFGPVSGLGYIVGYFIITPAKDISELNGVTGDLIAFVRDSDNNFGSIVIIIGNTIEGRMSGGRFFVENIFNNENDPYFDQDVFGEDIVNVSNNYLSLRATDSQEERYEKSYLDEGFFA